MPDTVNVRTNMILRRVCHLARFLVFAACVVCHALSAFAQFAVEFHRTLLVTESEPVGLEIVVVQGHLQVAYAREGQVSITAIAQAPNGVDLPKDFFTTRLSVEQSVNRVEIREQARDEKSQRGVEVAYRIDVPYRTEVHSLLNQGKETVIGIMGPVRAKINKGDIKVSYISKGAVVEVGSGNLDLQVIGERVEARTGRGDISCLRVAQGLSAETGEGDISLNVVGPSHAMVKRGPGRIDAGGVMGTLVASTDAGDLHVKAAPRDDWQLSSVSGRVRVELPPRARFELDLDTTAGEVDVQRDDIEVPGAKVRRFHQKVNGGGKHVIVRAENGKIIIA
jgi:putative adhesin